LVFAELGEKMIGFVFCENLNLLKV